MLGHYYTRDFSTGLALLETDLHAAGLEPPRNLHSPELRQLLHRYTTAVKRAREEYTACVQAAGHSPVVAAPAPAPAPALAAQVSPGPFLGRDLVSLLPHASPHAVDTYGQSLLDTGQIAPQRSRWQLFLPSPTPTSFSRDTQYTWTGTGTPPSNTTLDSFAEYERSRVALEVWVSQVQAPAPAFCGPHATGTYTRDFGVPLVRPGGQVFFRSSDAVLAVLGHCDSGRVWRVPFSLRRASALKLRVAERWCSGGGDSDSEAVHWVWEHGGDAVRVPADWVGLALLWLWEGGRERVRGAQRRGRGRAKRAVSRGVDSGGVDSGGGGSGGGCSGGVDSGGGGSGESISDHCDESISESPADYTSVLAALVDKCGTPLPPSVERALASPTLFTPTPAADAEGEADTDTEDDSDSGFTPLPFRVIQRG